MGKFDISAFAQTVAPVPESDTDMRWIALDDIEANPYNFYPAPDGDAMAELMASIEANGLLEPPTVIPVDAPGRYRLISGHSRMGALRRLRDRHPLDKRWERVLCRVLPPMDRGRELSAVIESNRQRVKSDALLAQEAEKLAEAYIKRKDAGEELPGRIRDRVAAALQVSKTKLANLSAIKKGIKVPGIERAWADGDIPEAAALMIARMDVDAQYRLLDWMIDKHRDYSIKEVQKFAAIWTCCVHKCPATAGLCPNAEAMYAAHYRRGEWHCAGCCKNCLSAGECPQTCQYAEAKVPETSPAPEAPDGGADGLPGVSPDVAAPASVWLPLDKAHWPGEGQLVVLSYEMDLGGSGYQLARCVDGPGAPYPFIDTDNCLSVDEMDDLGCDMWLPFPEAVRKNWRKNHDESICI